MCALPIWLGARYQWTHGPASADLEYYRTFAQNRVASYETRTEGYDMLNATMSYRLDVGSGKSVEFYARATTPTNELAFAHTSFLKDQSPLRGRHITLGMRPQFCTISRCNVRPDIRCTGNARLGHLERGAFMTVCRTARDRKGSY